MSTAETTLQEMSEADDTETLSGATTRLALTGYDEDSHAHEGRLACGYRAASHDPADMTIDEPQAQPR